MAQDHQDARALPSDDAAIKLIRSRCATSRPIAATLRTRQCVEPSAGLVCNVVLIRPATRSSSMLRGGPGHTSS